LRWERAGNESKNGFRFIPLAYRGAKGLIVSTGEAFIAPFGIGPPIKASTPDCIDLNVPEGSELSTLVAEMEGRIKEMVQGMAWMEPSIRDPQAKGKFPPRVKAKLQAGKHRVTGFHENSEPIGATQAVGRFRGCTMAPALRATGIWVKAGPKCRSAWLRWELEWADVVARQGDDDGPKGADYPCIV